MGGAQPAPLVGPALGQYRLNLMAFRKDFNTQTQKYKPNTLMAVTITAFKDNTFEFTVKSPSVTWYLKKTVGLVSGSSWPSRVIATTLSVRHIYEIAKVKQSDPYCQYMSLESIYFCIVMVKYKTTASSQVQSNRVGNLAEQPPIPPPHSSPSAVKPPIPPQSLIPLISILMPTPAATPFDLEETLPTLTTATTKCIDFVVLCGDWNDSNDHKNNQESLQWALAYMKESFTWVDTDATMVRNIWEKIFQDATKTNDILRGFRAHSQVIKRYRRV
ncbi:Mitochondrial ribosomal L11-like protein [Theobroma cacao]|uniref:Mitochondrial ribosomal L11-like protein n=1 Tax=Theobroma cacao TaxID=3641 RepID=A0A061DNL0_THECC|nr:Mitochondrial ribosomal L11-like protein [Theobroma cacao]